MNTTPFFSILVPTYNQAQYLGEALESLIAQTDPDWEAIIVNDGSTDSTANVLEQYAKKESRFRVFHKENGGVGSALNLALKEAKGQWICWLSSDDVFELNKLKVHRQWIEQHPEYKFFFSNFRQLVGTSGKIINLNPNLDKEIPPIELQIIEMLRRNYVAGNSICIFREAWLTTGYFNEELRYAQDYDMWLRLMLKYQAFFIPEYTYLQRVYPEQESQRFSDFCLYDSAKSSIAVLNTHNIEDLLPFLMLKKESAQVKTALRKIFDLVFDSSAFIYQLGFHPLFIFKTQQFVNQFLLKDHKNTLVKKLDANSKVFGNTPQGFWCRFSKQIITKNSYFLESSFLLSFEKLSENYYWFLNYIESDLQNSVLNYLEKFCNYNILANNNSDFKSTLQNLMDFQSPENQQEYLKILDSHQKEILPFSFIDKMIFLEQLNFPLRYISLLIFEQNNYLNSCFIMGLIFVSRILRLTRQQKLFIRMRGYINYRIHRT